MPISWFEFLGMVGVTVVVVMGSIFDPVREFLGSFTNRWNPLPWVGELISCALCSGVWVGFVGGWLCGLSWGHCVAMSGVVAMAAFVASNVLGMTELKLHSMTECGRHKSPLEELVAAKLKERQLKMVEADMAGNARQRRTIPGSEEEAHAMADQLDEHLDRVKGHVGD
jgi:hypothetical protein